jgi:hypothetical protein
LWRRRRRRRRNVDGCNSAMQPGPGN